MGRVVILCVVMLGTMSTPCFAMDKCSQTQIEQSLRFNELYDVDRGLSPCKKRGSCKLVTEAPNGEPLASPICNGPMCCKASVSEHYTCKLSKQGNDWEWVWSCGCDYIEGNCTMSKKGGKL
jgi:hypothetical protein